MIAKGSVLGWDWFYVVINDTGKYLQCICDNANNVYSFSHEEIRGHKDPHKWVVLTPLQAVEISKYGIEESNLTDEDKNIIRRIDRPIPVDVIAAALVGIHDERFDA